MCLALIGCGGNGGSSTVESSFKGLYQGPWAQTSFTGGILSEGAASISISGSGDVSGTFSVAGSPERSGSLQGKVRSNGSFSFTVTFSDGTEPYNGTLSLNGEKLTGPFGQPTALYAGNMPTFDLTRYTL